MDKQYYVLTDHKDKNISWKKGEIILLDPDLALPYVGVIIIPLYTAIKEGYLKKSEPKKPLITEVIQEIKDVIEPKSAPISHPAPPDSNDVIVPVPSKKKLLQNKLQAQILAKKAELAKQNS
jgi:hypothetical protein